MQAIQITNLTEDSIELLLTGDVPFSISRAQYERTLTDGKDTVTWGLNEDTFEMPLESYWQDYLGMSPHVDHINAYIAETPEIQLEIAMLDILDYVQHDMREDEASLLLLKSKVLHYGHCYFNAAVSYKPAVELNAQTSMKDLAASLLGFGTELNPSK